MAQELKTIKFTENGELYLRAFLLDTSKNENGWKVDSASVDQNIESFVGMPLVLTQEYDHPKWIEGGLIENVRNQLRYAIGQITKIIKTGSIRDAIIKITDPIARAAIENNDIPFFTSPRLAHDPSDPLDKIKNWLGLHLAIVNKPAFGDKAAVKGACYGAAEECHVALKDAKKDDCGFCVKTALLKLVNVVDAAIINTSQDTQSEKSQLFMETPTPNTVDLSGYVPKADHEKTRSEVETFKQANADLKKNFDEFKTSVEEERRKERLTSVLSTKIADKKVLEERITYFVTQKASPEVVETAYKDFPNIAVKADNTEKFAKVDAKAEPSGKWFAGQRALERALMK